ncbi:MAG: hypothetical protein B6I30_07005 [Desulfobacteraceae bacterium 4572_187]|nr:MAG: hypothetical protein B6I30_07005 [Desulfobacteraceae bacterium 4572_187]
MILFFLITDKTTKHIIRLLGARLRLFTRGECRITWFSLLKTQSFNKRTLIAFYSIALTNSLKLSEFIM